MSKKNYQEALNKIKNEYDAYYLGNFQDDLVENALNWIHDCYDCYYKEDFEDPQDDNPFNHLQGLIDKLEEL